MLKFNIPKSKLLWRLSPGAERHVRQLVANGGGACTCQNSSTSDFVWSGMTRSCWKNNSSDREEDLSEDGKDELRGEPTIHALSPRIATRQAKQSSTLSGSACWPVNSIRDDATTTNHVQARGISMSAAAMSAGEKETPGSAASPSASPAAVRVLETVVLPPSSAPPGPAPTETLLPLTYLDSFWLHSPPVERVFFYRLGPDADVDAVVSTLKTSLSRAVRAFYPLAGRVRLAPGSADRYELHYRPGDGVAFTVAEWDRDVDGLATDDAREVAALAPLLPPLPGADALLALQATKLISGRCTGLAVGVTVSHIACDGSGSTHFLHTWAAACTGAPAPPPPVIDRTLISDPGGLYDVFNQANVSRDDMEFVKMSPDQLLATFVLSSDDLQRIKDAVAVEATRRGVAPPRCSSLVATLGVVWSCYHRAKKLTSSSEGEGPTCLLFPVDHRSRMNPPLPDKYLGNCVGPGMGTASRAELTAPGAGGLFTACAAVAAAIQEALAEIGTPRVAAWLDRIREAAPMGVLSVAGSPRFRVYEVDFGFGAPAKVDIVSVARTGALGLAESRRRDGGGGMEVGVSLPPNGMDRFRECFADVVSWLRAGNDQ